jgi:hypothetical protein
VLDALDLSDLRIRLFAVERTRSTGGATQVYRIQVSDEVLNASPEGLSLSNLWVMGRLGGVPCEWHISTLHIWPARPSLAACRAAIIAALMADPGNEKERHELNQKIASITRWKTENGPALDYFREEIRNAFDRRAPRVLDMFAGGGDSFRGDALV